QECPQLRDLGPDSRERVLFANETRSRPAISHEIVSEGTSFGARLAEAQPIDNAADNPNKTFVCQQRQMFTDATVGKHSPLGKLGSVFAPERQRLDGASLRGVERRLAAPGEEKWILFSRA
ncbi:hypothetical protein, partial [Mesorhizobium sp. M7A.F.Ca.ET.027.03.2.1]|uniref:hypothetical protein n=1 Tax=Mesorhizobium sp. M7A.F.Ca.ET.027.03.2.1 TaxID=2496656 RepID=UPI001AECAB00